MEYSNEPHDLCNKVETVSSADTTSLRELELLRENSNLRTELAMEREIKESAIEDLQKAKPCFACKRYVGNGLKCIVSGQCKFEWRGNKSTDSATEPKVYAVDFDGYLCEEKWPGIGAPRQHIIDHFKSLKAQGHKLILWTCREGPALKRAVKWCTAHGLYFDAVNENLPERIAKYGNDTRKLGADFYCDDRNYPLMP